MNDLWNTLRYALEGQFGEERIMRARPSMHVAGTGIVY